MHALEQPLLQRLRHTEDQSPRDTKMQAEEWGPEHLHTCMEVYKLPAPAGGAGRALSKERE